MLLRNHAAADPPRCTEREMDILALVVEGHSCKTIGELLFISPRTVEFHKVSLYKKLEVSSRLEACHRATALGLLPTDRAA